jgi:hypothetical protein
MEPAGPLLCETRKALTGGMPGRHVRQGTLAEQPEAHPGTLDTGHAAASFRLFPAHRTPERPGAASTLNPRPLDAATASSHPRALFTGYATLPTSFPQQVQPFTFWRANNSR